MTIVLIVIHVIACIALIAIVLIQRGRGSGLVESFQGVESMFGPKTNTFLTRTTTVLSIVFFITCLSLALLSVRQSRSLMRDIKNQAAKAQDQKAVAPEATAQPAATQTASETQPTGQKTDLKTEARQETTQAQTK
jgi:preprotein translocase subunit SecG